MRDIKFRAWDKGENRWIDNMEFAIDPDSGKLLTASGDEMVWSNHSDYDLMQYTGLKDKNGVEIYEGDIVKCRIMYDYDVFSKPENVEVEFNDGRFLPMAREKMTKYRILPYYYDYEVIGNIYENPELL